VLRQIAILGIWPAELDNGDFLDGLFMPPRYVVEAVGLLTVTLEIPCRRSPPAIHRVWAETADETTELDLTENVVARLIALSKAGPMTIITFGGSWRDWPALKHAALRTGTDLGRLADLHPSSAAQIGEARLELVDLAMWLGGPTRAIRLGSPYLGSGLQDHAEAVAAKTAQLYRVFLRFLAVTGRLSGPVYRSADHNAGTEIRRLRNRAYKTGPRSLR
jgi:hypothetical protein